jgi:putative ABC transport system substrate-binding protein
MVKNILILLLLALLSVPFVSAADVGVAWQGKAAQTDQVFKGMTEELAIVAPDIKLEVQKELPKVDDVKAAVAAFEKTKKAVVILRSSGIDILKTTKLSIPAFFGACDSPVEMGLITSYESTGGNFTGVTYALPYEDRLDAFASVVGKITAVHLIVEKGHASSPAAIAGTKKACEGKSITFTYTEAATPDEAIAAAKAVEGKVTCVILGAQSLLTDGDTAGKIQAALSKTPVVAYADKSIKAGALCGLVADNEKLGRELGDSIKAVVMDGKKPSAVAVVTDLKPKLYINSTVAEKLGIKVPFDVLRTAKLVK